MADPQPTQAITPATAGGHALAAAEPSGPPAPVERVPVADLDPRLRELGRIRLGHRVATANGGRRPAALERFRLTSTSRELIDAASGVYGGRPEPWDNDGRAEHQVVIESDVIDVLIPPVRAFTQAWELWKAGGCHRRCDGRIEQLSGQPCRSLCPPAGDERNAAALDGEACSPTTRLNVLLPELPGFGVWRVETKGWYAAVELAGAQQLADLAGARGQLIAARIRIEPRTIRRPGEPRRDFVVPVVELPVTLGQLLRETGQTAIVGMPAAALDAPPPAGGLPAGGTAPAPARDAETPVLAAGSPQAALGELTDAAGITRPAVDALLRARYGTPNLAALDDDAAGNLTRRLNDANELARFRAAAAADLRAELTETDDVPF